jgi:hypothetical protein
MFILGRDGLRAVPFFSFLLELKISRTARRPSLVRLKVRTNSGVEVPIGQSTGCP